jgi:hypothetical protein
MTTAKSKHGGARKGAGRKPLEPGVKTVPVVVRVTELQKAKLTRLGGPRWIRARIDAARDPE